MRFEEEGCEKVDFDRECFVYFLLRDGEVVYVGQTTIGLSRIRQHKDKVFDEVYVLRCDKHELDELEGAYIIKYNQVYNRKLNEGAYMSMAALKSGVRKDLKRLMSNVPCMTANLVGQAVRDLGIKTYTYNDALYVKPSCFPRVLEYVMHEARQKGRR